jgi:hypothetical protein
MWEVTTGPSITSTSAEIYVEDILKAKRKDVEFRVRVKPDNPSVSIADCGTIDLRYL